MDCLIDPGLSKLDKESLRATFLFKSWRRRMMDPTMYHRYERDSDGKVRAAQLSFRALRANVLQFDGRIGVVGPPRASTRLAFYAREDTNLVMINDLLDTIPSVEDTEKARQGSNLLYIDIATNSLRKDMKIPEGGLVLMHRELVYPPRHRNYSVSPSEITTKDIQARESIAVEQGPTEANA